MTKLLDYYFFIFFKKKNIRRNSFEFQVVHLFWGFKIIFQSSNECHCVHIIIFFTQFAHIRLTHSHKWIDLFFLTWKEWIFILKKKYVKNYTGFFKGRISELDMFAPKYNTIVCSL